MQITNSRLILVGIANSIDLTERTLPRLQATGCRPALVTFPSYSSLQLECLLQQRLAALPGPVFQSQAVRLAAKKAGSYTLHCSVCTAEVMSRSYRCTADPCIVENIHAEVQGLCRLQCMHLSRLEMPCSVDTA